MPPTERPPLVLIIEDEPPIADVLRLYLDRAGYAVAVESDGMRGLAAVRERRPDAVILDVGLPGMDGTEICRRMRAEDDWTPVLFCTARDDEVDRVLGLELGGDDYITKPFSPREVVARVKVALRHAHAPDAGDVLVLGSVTLDRGARRVLVDGKEVALTATEFDLLAYLMRHPGRVITRDHLLEEVWGYASAVGTRTVDVHVAQVRAKLGDASPIRTVRGVGYSAEAA
ncbi:MAG: response regulator transcription factor [Actinobacteria bacterium]|nr:response regulator transcription factor [Actinomycetota bacterium]